MNNQNSNEIIIFNNDEFGRIRTLIVDDEIWFIGRDVAKVLGYSNSSKAVSKHVDKEDKQFIMMDITDSQNGNVLVSKSKTAFINESGLYSLILSSKLPNAKKFKRWVTFEVLPSIRKTGKYSVNPELQNNNSKIEREIAFMKFSQSIVESKDLPVLYKQTITAYMMNEISGKYLLPLPEVERTYTATEIANQLGISRQLIGRIANKNNLKTDEYGVQIMDISTNGNQVPNFRYNEVGKNKIIELVEKRSK